MKILITGAGGFIGRHVATLAVAAGHDVTAWGRSPLDLPGLAGNLPPKFLDEFEPAHHLDQLDAIIHLAGVFPRFGEPAPSPIDLFDHNAGLTTRLLDACARAGVKRFVLASTAAVYGNQSVTPLTESHALDIRSAYAASKASAEMMCAAYHCERLQTTSLRLFNVFGPRQAETAIIASLCRQALDEGPVSVADDRPVCDFVFVDDVATALLMTASCETPLPKVLNIGSGRGTSIRELGRIVLRAAGRDDEIHARNAKTGLMSASVADTSLAARHLKWRASTTLEQGVHKTIEALRADPVSYRNR